MSNWIKVEVKPEKKHEYPDAPVGEFFVTYVTLMKCFVDRTATHWYPVDALLVTDKSILNGHRNP